MSAIVRVATSMAGRLEAGFDPRPRNNFHALRLIAALLVVYGHQSGIDLTGTVGLRLLMFFAISGFLVAGSWTGDSHLWRFLARRFLRIWPAYALLVVVCAGLSWLIPARDMPEISRMASGFYLRNLWSPGFDWGFFPLRQPFMNQSLWMLPYEVDAYLAFAAIALLGRRARIGAAIAVLMLAAGSEQTVRADGGLLECWSPFLGGFFAFGVLLREVPWLRRTAIAAGCVAVGACALLAGWRTPGLLLTIPPAAVWIGLHAWPVLRSAARFGDLSFGVFLWSYPIQQVTRLWLDTSHPVLLQFAVVVLQVIPVAWLSCRFVETPALQYKPARPGRSSGTRVAVAGGVAP